MDTVSWAIERAALPKRAVGAVCWGWRRVRRRITGRGSCVRDRLLPLVTLSKLEVMKCGGPLGAVIQTLS